MTSIKHEEDKDEENNNDVEEDIHDKKCKEDVSNDENKEDKQSQ